MREIKVSIIIPVYNVEKYLRQCLDSVINQTLKDIEIICVNDGSTDNSKQILEEYAEKESRIKIINKKNAGLGAARNTGMEYVTGEYMGFVDSDDWVDVTMFEKLYESCKIHDTDISMCPIMLVNESSSNLNRETAYFDLLCFNEEFNNRPFNLEQTKDFVMDIAVNAVNKIYRTEFIKYIDAKFPEGLLFEDVPFFYKTYLNAKSISLVRDHLYYHILNRPNSITAKADKNHFDIVKIQNLMVECFQSLPNFNEFKIEVYNKKIFRIVRRYFDIDEIYREEFFELIKQDFKKMNLKDDEIAKLHSSIKKHYLNIINSNSSVEFEIKENKVVTNKKSAKKLVISYCFPPYVDTSANVMAKRIREYNEVVDVVQNDMSDVRSVDEKNYLLIEGLIENQIIINSKSSFGSWTHIKDFCEKGMEEISNIVSKKGEYEEIYSRSMFPASHFLAFEYKIKFPNVKWIAEFSDPILYDTNGNIRESKIDTQEFLDKVNNLLSQKDFPKYRQDNLYFLSEYLPYIFADEIIFTNENQKEFMINKFPLNEIIDEVEKKAQIKRHPTLKKEFYHLIESNYALDDGYVNIAYFGNFYESRNLNDIFYALFGLDNDYKNKCKMHFFISDPEGLKKSMMCSPVIKNLEVNQYVSFLEFLNLTTKFDCLIVNDAQKNGEINPYLPSKLSDYMGSGTDIWAICEENSVISKFDVRYKSILGNTKSTRETLAKIVEDHISRYPK